MKKITVCPDDDLQSIFDKISEPTEILLRNGVYNQKLKLEKSDVILTGESRRGTVVSYGDFANKIHADGRKYNTFRTYTLLVTGERTRIQNMTIENGAPADGGQSVALSVHGESFIAENADIKSRQDTLFLAPFPQDPIVKDSELIPPELLARKDAGVHIFRNCLIEGTVDFIFGCSEAYFYDCDIVSLANGGRGGYIAAPAHTPKQQTGFCFIDCRLKDGGEGSGVYLARPWRDYGMCAFINCKADGHLHEKLVNKWNNTDRDRTARFSYYNLKGFSGCAEPWAKALTDDEARAIISQYEQRLAEYGLK